MDMVINADQCVYCVDEISISTSKVKEHTSKFRANFGCKCRAKLRMAGNKRHFAVRGPKPGQYNLRGRNFAPSSQNQQVLQQIEFSEVKKSLERYLQSTNYKKNCSWKAKKRNPKSKLLKAEALSNIKAELEESLR